MYKNYCFYLKKLSKLKFALRYILSLKEEPFLLIIMLFFATTSSLNAQVNCGFDVLKNEQNKTGFPWIDALEDELQDMIANIEDNNIVVDVEIPVIVHIIHESGQNEGGAVNIDEQRVTDAIANLNSDFASTGIQFCKAKRYPDGTPLEEHGIVRVNASSVDGYSSTGMTLGGQIEFDVKNLGPQFSNYNYLNIWTVKSIQGLDPNGEVRGFAYFPLRTDVSLDGVTMDVDFFGIPNNKILTHEVGHYLSLYHSFEGDDSDYDGVADG